MMFSRLLISFLISLCLISESFSSEYLESFEEKNLSVLNDELRKFDKDILENKFTSGMILLWSGAISDIPNGWVICDGTNSTPNLTDRFVLHADADSGGTNDVGDTGGVNSVTLTAAQSGSPAHTHTFTLDKDAGSGGGLQEGGDRQFEDGTRPVNASAAVDAAEAHENRPKFYALAYIMKT